MHFFCLRGRGRRFNDLFQLFTNLDFLTFYLYLRNIGSMFSCRDVESRAHNYMLERFELVCQTEEFIKLGNHIRSRWI